MRRGALIVAAVGFYWLAYSSVRAVAADDPLRLIPGKANLVLKIENPRKLIESIRALPAFAQARQLDAVRTVLDAAPARRLFEFISYYERDFQASWPELLDKLAGGGVALGSTIDSAPDNPVLMVVQARDESALEKFVRRAVEALEQDMSRADAKNKLVKDFYHEIECWHVGMDLHACRIGKALLVANRIEALHAGIDQHLENLAAGPDKGKSALNSPGIAKARKLLPADPKAWLWYDLDYLKSRPEAKNVLVTPRNDTVLTVLFAGYLDIVRRGEFVAAGLYQEREGFALAVRLPAGRDGMAADVEIHVPADIKAGGTLPLIELPGLIFSESFYLDAGAVWTKRDRIMTEQNLKQFEKGLKDASRFLPGTSIDKLLVQSGVHHRIVAVQRPPAAGYKTEPQVRIPAFAFITSMRDPKFAKSLELLIRGGLALASTQVSVKFFEDKHGDVRLFGYSFPEDGKFPNDEQGTRFNFTPSFAVVDDQIILASTRELCLELIDALRREDRGRHDPQTMQVRINGSGFAELINASPEQLLLQTILSQAVSEAQAKKQVEQLLEYLRGLGHLSITTEYLDKEFHFDIKWNQTK